VRLLARFMIILVWICDRAAGGVSRVQQLLAEVLPAVLPPNELTKLIRNHYEDNYQGVAARLSKDSYRWTLENWEERVLACHKIVSGTILVLGAGVGRESIALAQRGFQVVGIDINRESLCVASQQALAGDAHPLFAQADFLAIPIGLDRVDYVLMSGIMYSSIPGRRQRQAWLRSLRACMNKQGLLVLNFLITREIETRTHQLIHTFNLRLMTLPGANQSYQLGDTCSQNHFLHAFADEEEIRSELREAGATVNQLLWQEGCAVLSWPS